MGRRCAFGVSQVLEQQTTFAPSDHGLLPKRMLIGLFVDFRKILWNDSFAEVAGMEGQSW